MHNKRKTKKIDTKTYSFAFDAIVCSLVIIFASTASDDFLILRTLSSTHFLVSAVCFLKNQKTTKKNMLPPEKRKASIEWTLPNEWTQLKGTPLSSDWTYSGKAGLPVTSEDNIPDGRRTLQNSASRTHRVLNDDEIHNGKQARWLELEVHGELFC
jgi:hypothetical protein